MQAVTLTTEELKKLLGCGCPDGLALYLYRKAGGMPETALDALHFTMPQMVGATDCLRQLGLWEGQEKPVLQPVRPEYTDEDLQSAIRSTRSTFSHLIGEAQRRLGRTLSTEELKTLLLLTDYLRLPPEIIGLLISYCIERNRRSCKRPPSMRAIEKEAYHWADEGIDSLEVASYHVQTQLQHHTRVQHLRLLLQIDQRRLTSSEEQYLLSWVSMGFPDEVIRLAYERTCLNTGCLKWAYMNSILKSWHEKGLMTLAQISDGDSAPANRDSKGYQHHDDPLTAEEKAAIECILAEGQEG